MVEMFSALVQAVVVLALQIAGVSMEPAKPAPDALVPVVFQAPATPATPMVVLSQMTAEPILLARIETCTASSQPATLNATSTASL